MMCELPLAYTHTLFEVALDHGIKFKGMLPVLPWKRYCHVDVADQHLMSNKFEAIQELTCMIESPVILAEGLHVDAHLNHVVLLVLCLNLIPDLNFDQLLSTLNNFLKALMFKS